MKFEKHDIISLKNNKKYVISELLNYNDNKYLQLVEVDEEENLKEEIKTVKVVKNMAGNYGVDEITDNAELLAVQKIFFEMIT